MADDEVYLPAGSALNELPAGSWSLESGSMFEVAQDVIGLVVARLTCLIDIERSGTAPDSTAIQAWTTAVDRATTELHALPSDDVAAATDVQQRYATLLADLDR